ncbi:MAG: signal peptidase I [Gemmatimonadaceae bacterium]
MSQTHVAQQAAVRARTPESTPAGAKKKGGWRHLLKELAIAAAIFFIIKIFFLEAFRIPSGSMEPTLLVGDFLFVNKLVYGPHLPIIDVNLPGYAEPARNEIAVYRSPDERDGHPTVVKRIMGVEGDTLHMRAGLLYVNGTAERPTYVAPSPMRPGAEEAHPDFVWQKRFEARGSRFGEPPTVPTHDHWGPIVVPPDHFFTLGDNRYNSKDARYYGWVPRENVRGRPLFIYLSVDFEAWRIRWGRFGMRVQ